MNDAIFTKVQNVIVEHLGVEQSQVKPDAQLMDDLGADSLDALDLLLAINEAFAISIPPEKLEDINTVAQLVEVVEKAQ